MAAKFVNLRQERKHLAWSRNRAVADANAVRHGQIKAEQALRFAQEDLERRRLDAHRNEDADDRE